MAYTRHFTVDQLIPADAAAADAANYYLLGPVPEAVDNLVVKLTPGADVTENDTDYATLEINSATGASATLTSMMTAVTTKITGGIDLDAGVTVTLTLDTSDALAKGLCLVLKVTKAASGQALPDMLVHVEGDYVQT